MRCQRCGFEIENGQTFCSMCGTEQSRALRVKKKSPKSILWIIKITSKAHLKMWLVFLTSIALVIFANYKTDKSSPLVLSVLCLSVVLLGYELFQILLGYKNPNATKTKAYKIRYRVCAILAGLLVLVACFLNFSDLATAVDGFFTKYR